MLTNNAFTQNTAVLLIEYQKTWTEKGIFYNMIKKELNSNHVIDNTLRLTEKARNNNISIIHAPMILDKNNREQYKKMPLPPRILNRFTKGTWKAEYTEGMYHPTDLIVEGRIAFDATVGSNLISILRKNNIDTVYVCGFTTDHCVKETMQTLNNEGFNSIMVSDCTATRNHKLQKKAEKQLQNISSNEIISIISQQE